MADYDDQNYSTDFYETKIFIPHYRVQRTYSM